MQTCFRNLKKKRKPVTVETSVCSSKSYIPQLFARFGTQKTIFRSRCRFLGESFGFHLGFVCQFLNKRTVSRFLFQIRTKPRWNIDFCCASVVVCVFFSSFSCGTSTFFFSMPRNRKVRKRKEGRHASVRYVRVLGRTRGASCRPGRVRHVRVKRVRVRHVRAPYMQV